MSDRQDEALRRALRTAHADDRAPAFGATWTRAAATAASRRRRAALRGLALAGGLAVAAVAALVLLPAGSAPLGGPDAGMATAAVERLVVPDDITGLARWSGPTEFLLSASADELLSGTPTLGEVNTLTITGIGPMNVTSQ